SAFIRKTTGTPETESEALQLLKFIWNDMVLNLSKNKIDDKLRGPSDSIKSDSIIHIARLDKHLSKLREETEKLTKDAGQVSEPRNLVDSKLRNLVSEHVEDMHAEIQTLSKENKMASGKGDQALELQKLISEYIVNIHLETKRLIKQEAGNPDQLHNLKRLYEIITKMRTATTKETYSSRVLFVAAEVGNTTFLVELIRLCPDLIWKLDDNNQTIFHIAVKHRHEGIYNLLYEIGAMKDMITPIKDRQDNNMLHLVGKSAKEKRLEDVSGVALQMQRQLLWFQEVKNTIPPSYRERKNEDGLTPHELFTKEHKELVSQGEKWMKGTASQCMVVATLIATIVFAAAFTVPGGYTQSDDHKNKGLPVFRSEATFVVFVVADAISLFSSSGSIIIFLSILTSRYAERDFLESIPNKLMAGLATLFISIATMTQAYRYLGETPTPPPIPKSKRLSADRLQFIQFLSLRSEKAHNQEIKNVKDEEFKNVQDQQVSEADDDTNNDDVGYMRQPIEDEA
ncbi:ankyrin repeat-containing domain, PGG domain protein, partial [Tanacetum coccineum]